MSTMTFDTLQSLGMVKCQQGPHEQVYVLHVDKIIDEPKLEHPKGPLSLTNTSLYYYPSFS